MEVICFGNCEDCGKLGCCEEYEPLTQEIEDILNELVSDNY